jgi:hypothetical protein
VTITGCTFYANSADYGGAIYNYDSSATVSNCILWADSAPDGPEIYGDCTVSYSDVEGGFAGTGNIDADPCFADAGGDDFHLLDDSPCIEVGDPAYSPAGGETDIDGEPRVMGLTVDMGADEFTIDKPIFKVWPNQFEFLAGLGGPNPPSQILSIRNIGADTLNWQIAETCSWLEVAPAGGQSTGDVNEVAVSVDVTGLAAGPYYCQLTVSDPCATNSPQTVDVNVTVRRPVIELSSYSFEFTSGLGGPNPADQILTIRNSGAGALNWEIAEDCNWLSAEPNTGSSSGEANEVTLAVNTAGLAWGQYDCQLAVFGAGALNSPRMVAVALTVRRPVIDLSALSLVFYADEGGTNPLDLMLTIRNGGAGTLNWDLSEDCGWLSVEPNTGSSTGEADDVNVGIDISGLTAGIYNCALSVSDPNAENHPQTVAIKLYVLTTGQLHVPSEFGTIQLAIDVAQEGATVVVAPGTYTGDGNKNLDYGGKAIIVRSTDPEDPCVVAATVIDCEDTGRGFYFHSGEGPNSVLSGLTITRGKTYRGGGIYCSGSSPTIENCIITNNTADTYGSSDCQNACGAGIYCTSSSNPTISNCTLSDNTAKGCDACCPFDDFNADGGDAYGGAMYIGSFCSVNVVNCTIGDNRAKGGRGSGSFQELRSPPGRGGKGAGGGIYCDTNSSPVIENCAISNNRAAGGEGGWHEVRWGYAHGGEAGNGLGAGVYAGLEATVVMQNCTCIANRAYGGNGGNAACVEGCESIGGDGGSGHGGGLFSRAAEVTAKGCTISENICVRGNGGEPNGNDGADYGGGIYGSITISNCILWADTPDEIHAAGPVVTYSDVQGGWPGTGNIDADPCFVWGPEGDYYLSQIVAGQALDSPCVDAGSDSAVNLGMDVLATRTDEVSDVGTVDMGYHYPAGILSGGPDINLDLHVDSFDYCILAGYWGQCNEPCDANYLPGDIIKDHCVDANDLKVLVDYWLDCYVGTASAPGPPDSPTGVDPNLTLMWSPGYGALFHDVYFGTDGNAVAEADHLAPEYVGTVSGTNFDPCGLEFDASYFWRIDEIGPSCIARGDLWSFATWGEPNSHLVGWWKFDEGTDGTAYDSAGDNDGTLMGDPNWVPGQVGPYALDFDGDGDHIYIPDANSLTPPDAITISWWIYNRGGQNVGIYKYAACPSEPASPGNSRAYHLRVVDNTNSVAFAVFSYADTSGRIEGVGTVSRNVWHHIAATFDEGNAAIYIDGQLDNSATMSVSSIMNDAHPLIIGGYWEYCGNTFNTRLNGIIDDVRIYNRALSAAEVDQLYQQ